MQARGMRALAHHRLGALGQVIHGEMHALQLASLDRQVARPRGTGAQHHRVEILEHHLRFVVLADLGIADELDALLLHQPDAAHDHFVLVELHVRNAVHEQPAGPVRALEHGDAVAGLVELGGRREARGTGADHRHALAGALLRGLGKHPAFVPAALDDGVLDVLDRDRRGIDAEHAGALTGCGADPARELREVVGLVQAIERLAPQAAVDQVVPLRDQVVDGAPGGAAAHQLAGVAERHAAVHAACGLVAQGPVVQVMVEFLPVADAFGRRTVQRQFAQVFDESGRLAHLSYHPPATGRASFLRMRP